MVVFTNTGTDREAALGQNGQLASSLNIRPSSVLPGMPFKPG